MQGKRIRILHGLIVLAAMAVAESAVAGGTFYGVGHDGQLFTIDTHSGKGTFVADISGPCAAVAPGTPVTEIEFDKLSRRAFAQCAGSGSAGVEFNIATGAIIGVPIANSGSYTGLETVGTTWFGTVITGQQGQSQLRTIDPFTGVSTLVGSTGVGPISGLAHDRRSGAMYGIAGGLGPALLYTINLGTGLATLVGSTGIQAGSLEFGPDDRLYAGGTGSNAGKLFVINPATAISTLVGPVGVTSAGITGLALTQCYDPSNPFENCGFETGTFTSWVTQDLAPPFYYLRVAGRGQTPAGWGFFKSDPTEGIVAALHGWDGAGPGHIRVAQDVTLPSGETGLAFDYRVAWNLTDYCIVCADRTFNVMVEPTGGGIPLATTRILTAPAHTTNLDGGNRLGTVSLGAFAGQSVRVAFDWEVPEYATGPAFFQLDNVRISSAGYFTVSPCRVVDTRNPWVPLGGPALAAGTDRTFTIAGTCGIPLAAKAVSVNLAVTQSSATGNLRLYPAGAPLPVASSINYSDGQTRSNNAIVPLSALGEMAVRCAQASGTAHFILDVNGYFQ